MVTKDVVRKIRKFYTEYESVDQMYGYLHALEDMGHITNDDANEFTGLLFIVGDENAAFAYLEESAV